jgi:uncharacterized protein YjbJ (UPF0337 family)
MSSGTTDEAKGRLKEAAGALTDDDKLRSEGKADQTIGKVKDVAQKVLDKTKKLMAQDLARQLDSGLRTFVRERPFTAVAAAVATGFVFGRLLRR